MTYAEKAMQLTIEQLDDILRRQFLFKITTTEELEEAVDKYWKLNNEK